MKKDKTSAQNAKVQNDFNVIASDVNVVTKVNTNVVSSIDVISEKTEKTKVNITAKKKQNSLKNRVEILRDVLLNTIEGKSYMNLSGYKIEDVTVENIKNIYSNVVLKNGKKQFFKFVVSNEKNVVLKSDILNIFESEIDNFELAYNEKNRKFLPILNSDKILFLCGKIEYTIKIVETLSYIEVLNRIKSYKVAKMLFENRIEREAQKAQKAQKVDYNKMTLDEIIAHKKSLETVETVEILKNAM